MATTARDPHVALVQGASRGRGLAFVERLLAREDLHVVATARNPAGSAGLAALRARYGPRLLCAPLDVRDLANVSARVGSIGDNRLGGWYGYRASKAAQDMFTRTLAIELRRRAPRVVCVALHPGTVETDLSAPFRGGVPPERRFSPDRAAEQLLDVIDSLGADDTGSFLDWARQPILW